ncbi:hypothetical protein CI102_8526 [Trichoderma harzianum]|uniref:Uncharacterized protein n=1 Tax=Trichoderma harzianum CBS 226.95 TaxID=983964 RepID=A0A2T4ATQ0_TRIHA|nr:hypothetical protein M431DRAFT_181202 [Trichoderma harzianum CBS 226.95]PKK47737.1 hypothetical protein CI102_8526 [Trichoderma harzianum]PTB60443.1 hypothetical protein M431DRAFT_181202 [Trichoderma harzianum CBS 226.95]
MLSAVRYAVVHLFSFPFFILFYLLHFFSLLFFFFFSSSAASASVPTVSHFFVGTFFFVSHVFPSRLSSCSFPFSVISRYRLAEMTNNRRQGSPFFSRANVNPSRWFLMHELRYLCLCLS